MSAASLSEISRIEYEQRLDKLRAAMAAAALDAVILTEEANVRWLTGYWVCIMHDGWSPTAAVVPRAANRAPCLLMGAEATGEPLSRISDIRYWEGGLDPDLAVAKADVLANTLRELDAGRGRIGVELGNGMRFAMDQNDIDTLRGGLVDAVFVDASDMLWRLRSIKSDSEIAKIREAARITCDSFRELYRILRAGVTERELAQHVQSYWFEHGATGVSHVMIGFGRHAVRYAHCYPKQVRLQRGEIASIDLGCCVDGYRADIFRLACVGNPDPEEARVADVIRRANRAMVARVRPGAPFGEVYAAAAALFEEEGLMHLLPSSVLGHGVGLGLHEWPFIRRDSTEPIKAGMVLAVEPWTVDYSDRSFGFNVEDMVVVTEDGCEELSDLDRGIFLA